MERIESAFKEILESSLISLNLSKLRLVLDDLVEQRTNFSYVMILLELVHLIISGQGFFVSYESYSLLSIGSFFFDEYLIDGFK